MKTKITLPIFRSLCKGRKKIPGCKKITKVICIRSKLSIYFIIKSNCFLNFHEQKQSVKTTLVALAVPTVLKTDVGFN